MSESRLPPTEPEDRRALVIALLGTTLLFGFVLGRIFSAFVAPPRGPMILAVAALELALLALAGTFGTWLLGEVPGPETPAPAPPRTLTTQARVPTLTLRQFEALLRRARLGNDALPEAEDYLEYLQAVGIVGDWLQDHRWASDAPHRAPSFHEPLRSERTNSPHAPPPGHEQ